ncbi:hypothetical protein Patl1_06019 [Pistacia atlantica]|uniref:Uncharacterized protein n=1 Tax=Pistacia atlantica TaxID=434234 RepID=A0ACC1BVX7_9ROSI|nr:hypothetical protein Patl1_06019 [Pistacia atlantica]
MVNNKGKSIAVGRETYGKRKRKGAVGGAADVGDNSRRRQRKNPGVLQFFEDTAAVDDDDDEESDSSDDDDAGFNDEDFMQEEVAAQLKVNNEQGKSYNLPFFPKEEVIDEVEFGKLMEERYKDGSNFVSYVGDDYESKRMVDSNYHMAYHKDPIVWKVKCMVGRERHSAFCLMQKFVDLQSFGTKLQIISAFSIDHIKGFIYIEADKQADVNEACKGLSGIYTSRMAPVPQNEVSHLFSTRIKYNEVSVGTWAYVKSGKYKGDLAQVVAVNNARKRATVKLIPRIDLQALAAKFMTACCPVIFTILMFLVERSRATEWERIFLRVDENVKLSSLNGKIFLLNGMLAGILQVDRHSTVGQIIRMTCLDGGGVSLKKNATAAPRLISSSELDEFRPLIQYRRDRETGQAFEILDGMMLKDGYLYKRVSIDSLNCWGVVPSEEELLKFMPSDRNESADLEWLSQLYGEKKKKRTVPMDKGGSKGECSSGSSLGNSFELFELVCFGRKDFGLIVSMEKDDQYKILKEGPEGPAVVPVERRMLKAGPFDMKFTALDQHMKIISVNDTVRVLEGPTKDRQGIVRQIYRGIIFLYDENETENGGYFCTKSQLCEKIKISADACDGKGGGSGASGFEELVSSPKSPLSPKKPWQAKEFNVKRGDKDGMFSVGQTLRIRVGPLKGYLCRVLAIRYSEITVKLDSQQKVLTVKGEHLAEVRGKSFATSTSDDPGSDSFKPFDLLGTEGSAGGWMNGAGTSAEGDRWNAGGSSGERSPVKIQEEDSAWECKATANQNSSWGAAVADGKNEDCWNKAAVEVIGSDSGASGSWGKSVVPSGDPTSSLHASHDNWGNAKGPADPSKDASSEWGKNNDANGNQDSCKKSDPWDKGMNTVGNSNGWGAATAEKNQLDSWGKGKDMVEDGANRMEDLHGAIKVEGLHGIKKISTASRMEDLLRASKMEDLHGASRMEDLLGASRMEDLLGASRMEDLLGVSRMEDLLRASKMEDLHGVSKMEDPHGASKMESLHGASRMEDLLGASNMEDLPWGKQDGGSSWGKQDGGSSWGKQDGGSSWGKQDGESSWGKQDGGLGNQDGESSWGKQDGGSYHGKQDGGSSWGKQDDQGKSWEKPQGFDGGRGSGGRWGRGGGRGGRDQSGTGRSFGRGQSSGWEKEGPGNNWASNGDARKSWNAGSRASFDDHGTDWKSGTSQAGGNPSNRDNKSSDWSASLKTSQDKSCGWNKESAADKVNEHKDQGDGCNNRKTSDGGSATGWGQCAGLKEVNDSSRDQDSKWGKNSNWNSGSSDAGRNQDSNWGKKSNWNSGSSDAGGNQDSNWGKKSSWNSGSGDAGGNQDSTWGKKS